MKVYKYNNGKYYSIIDEQCGDVFGSDNGAGHFSSLETLENHVKLMLIAVQQYKENKLD